MHPELLSLFLFMLGTGCSPGPNNIVASYSGFNFGITKTIPHMLGVILGFTLMVSILNFGLINIFKLYPLLQEILKISGSVFLIYLAYKIAFSKNQDDNNKQNPVKFVETFFFQFLKNIFLKLHHQYLFHLCLFFRCNLLNEAMYRGLQNRNYLSKFY